MSGSLLYINYTSLLYEMVDEMLGVAASQVSIPATVMCDFQVATIPVVAVS
jgi:peptidoglycan biosynthesis protein MviN/MurJ (putative lipid II flippase)